MLYILQLVASTCRDTINSTFHFLTADYFKALATSTLQPPTMKNIIILGGSYSGVSTAHRILKHASSMEPFKITLVSPNDHFYWSMAAPRGLMPGGFSDEKIFQPIAPGFSHYSARQFEFVQGTAKSLDVDSRKVGILTSAGLVELSYDFLVLATGTHAKEGMPFKELGSTEKTKAALHAFQANIKRSKTIVVAGTGATGTETAGELGFEFGQEKKIILIASGPTVLEGTPPNVHNVAQKELGKLNVRIIFNTKIKSSSPQSNGQLQLVLSNGEEIITDMYIPTFGLEPNSAYVPNKFLDSRGFVEVNEQYFTVKGASDIWAIGDVSSFQTSQFLVADVQSTHLAKNIVLMLSNKAPVPYKAGTIPMGLSIGKRAGVGHFAGWRMPQFIIVYFRRNLFSENLGKFVDGSMF